MIKFEYFQYMLAIWKAGSINKTADSLYLSQPYLSTTLKTLEGEIGAKLFKRSNRGIKLTSEGEAFIEYAKEIELILEKVTALGSQKTEISNRLSILSFYSYSILDLYYEFSHKEPYHNFALSYEETQNISVIDKMTSGSADLGILYLSSEYAANYISELKKMDMTFVKLFQSPVYAIVSQHHPLANLSSVSIKELEAYPLQFNNNRSLLYYLTNSNDSFSLGQLKLNESNPLTELQLAFIKVLETFLSVMVRAENALPYLTTYKRKPRNIFISELFRGFLILYLTFFRL